MLTHTRTHTRSLTNTHTHTHSHTHSLTHTHSHALSFTLTNARMHAHTHTPMPWAVIPSSVTVSVDRYWTGFYLVKHAFALRLWSHDSPSLKLWSHDSLSLRLWSHDSPSVWNNMLPHSSTLLLVWIYWCIYGNKHKHNNKINLQEY